jgi:uncharacterized protein (TIGR03086 family)
MSDISERYRRLSGDVAATIGAVPDDRWGDRSPCSDWTARDVVGHLVQTQGMFLGFVGDEVAPGPTVDDDPAAAWDHARAAVQARLDDPARAAAPFEGLLGPTTFEESVDRFLNSDLVLHRWDLAAATGQDLALDPDDMAHVREAMADLEDRMRGPGAFGPKLTPPEGADEQARFLAWAGRRA